MAANVKILFRKDKINKDGVVPIYLKVIKNRNSQQISLGITVPEKYWDVKNKRVKKGMENSQRLNNYISHKVAEAEGHALDLETKSKTITSKAIKEAVVGKAPESFLKYADRFFIEMENKLQASSIDKTKHIIGKVRTYIGKTDLTFDEISNMCQN
ncbi:MAG: Arm DNA-binding domain-containing protein [Bacteroidia bacterium]